LFTQTNVRWKRLFCAIEPASAVELITRIATPAAATHQTFFAFIVYPFPDCSRPPTVSAARAQSLFTPSHREGDRAGRALHYG
jgi:hypothetical protein